MARGRASRWRLDARARIREALAALPPDADDAARRRAVREACPYLPRSPGDGGSHGYKMWLKEVRLALGLWRRRRAAKSNTVSLTLEHGVEAGVRCGWCGCGPEDMGCIACSDPRAEWVMGAGELAQSFTEDAHPGIIADELEEKGFKACARLLRKGFQSLREEGK